MPTKTLSSMRVPSMVVSLEAVVAGPGHSDRSCAVRPDGDTMVHVVAANGPPVLEREC
jgi:hypothetical protein